MVKGKTSSLLFDEQVILIKASLNSVPDIVTTYNRQAYYQAIPYTKLQHRIMELLNEARGKTYEEAIKRNSTRNGYTSTRSKISPLSEEIISDREMSLYVKIDKTLWRIKIWKSSGKEGPGTHQKTLAAWWYRRTIYARAIISIEKGNNYFPTLYLG